jgi:CheY-like chemotaxis protein
MRQVLINLLSNAVKFTPEGGSVKLSVGSISADLPHHHRGNWVFFSARDTGIGIASEDLAKLFQPFVQIDSRLNRKYEGTGLGLVLVKQIVELHGGWIDVESELGQGSCFTIYLPSPEPLLDPPIESLSPEDLAISPSLKILLAEDNEVNINTFSSYLTTQGYQIILAYNGQDAIDLAQTHHPDLILMDIQMPKLNGLEAIARIRQYPDLAGIPIIALTALIIEADREKCLAAGANDYLTKPVSLKQLNHTIQKWLDLTSIKKSHP